MNRTINLQALVEAIATDTSTDPSLVENFLRVLTDEITDILSEGKQVHVPGIGTFGVVKTGTETDIVWQPDEDMANEINSPFSSFEPVILAENVTEEILNGKPESEPQENTDTSETESLATLETLEPLETPETPNDTEPTETEDTQEPGFYSGWWWGIFALLLSAVIGYLCATYLPNPLRDLMATPQDNYEETGTAAEPDPTAELTLPTGIIADSTDLSVKDEPEVTQGTAEQPQTKQPVVTDTVRNGRFLATMARHHYGSYKFWVYIYLENADRIKNPDNLPVGTVLVIPPAEKYDIDAHNPESIARAEAEIKRIEEN